VKGQSERVCAHGRQSWCIMRELSHMIYNVADEDVQRAQNQLKASILFSQDGPSGALQPAEGVRPQSSARHVSARLKSA
jgi:hypothetical protein